MPLPREFKELAVAGAEKDSEFRQAVITEALNMTRQGEITTG